MKENKTTKNSNKKSLAKPPKWNFDTQGMRTSDGTFYHTPGFPIHSLESIINGQFKPNNIHHLWHGLKPNQRERLINHINTFWRLEEDQVSVEALSQTNNLLFELSQIIEFLKPITAEDYPRYFIEKIKQRTEDSNNQKFKEFKSSNLMRVIILYEMNVQKDTASSIKNILNFGKFNSKKLSDYRNEINEVLDGKKELKEDTINELNNIIENIRDTSVQFKLFQALKDIQ